MNNNQISIIKALNEGKIAKCHNYTWRWEPRWKGSPSLNNKDVSQLMRADILSEKNGILIVTQWGSVIFNKETNDKS